MDANERIEEHLRVITELRGLVPEIEAIADEMTLRISRGGKVVWMGNGGSAADSQHLAAELVGRFEAERAPISSIAFSTNTSILTAIGNDYGYEQVFERQMRALCSAGDVAVGISTSGNSGNILRALTAAGELGVYRVGLTGRDGGRMLALCDRCLLVPSDRTARIQEAHILIGHIICGQIERAMLAAEENDE